MIGVVACAALGAVLRLYGLGDQLLLSDEWHSLHAAAVSSYGELLGLLTPGATSIPMNLYDKLLLDSVGWSEPWLRAPSVLSGIALLLLFPILVRGILSPRAALLGSMLLAVSPFLVFYSRYCRPYSLVVLLSFVSLVAAFRWARDGRSRHAVTFLASGAAAAALHPLELRSLAIPLGLLLTAKLLDLAPASRGRAPRVACSLPAILSASLAAGLLALLLVVPFASSPDSLLEIAGRGRVDGASLAGSLVFVTGTASIPWIALLLGLALVGFWRVASERALLAALLAAVSVGDVASVWISSPVDSQHAFVVARYLVPLLPVHALLVASGLDAVLRRLETAWRLPERVGDVLVGVVPLALLLAGPLPRLLEARNDFTHHKAVQSDYAPPADAAAQLTRYLMRVSGRLVPKVGVHPFYASLRHAPRAGAVVEYPVTIGDRYVAYGVSQRQHGRRVIGGYQPRAPAPGRTTPPGNLHPEWPVGIALGPVRDTRRLRLRNFVDVGDPAAVRRTGAAYLIVHPQLERKASAFGVASADLPELLRRFRESFGEPVHADPQLIVFEVGDAAG